MGKYIFFSLFISLSSQKKILKKKKKEQDQKELGVKFYANVLELSSKELQWKTRTQDFKPRHIFQTTNFKSDIFQGLFKPRIYILRTLFSYLKKFQTQNTTHTMHLL